MAWSLRLSSDVAVEAAVEEDRVGHSRRATDDGMAEWTPNLRAS